jgi:hypothetical protein
MDRALRANVLAKSGRAVELVGDIALGHSEQPWYRHVLGLTVVQRLIRHGGGFDLHLLDSQEPSP